MTILKFPQDAIKRIRFICKKQKTSIKGLLFGNRQNIIDQSVGFTGVDNKNKDTAVFTNSNPSATPAGTVSTDIQVEEENDGSKNTETAEEHKDASVKDDVRLEDKQVKPEEQLQEEPDTAEEEILLQNRKDKRAARPNDDDESASKDKELERPAGTVRRSGRVSKPWDLAREFPTLYFGSGEQHIQHAAVIRTSDQIGHWVKPYYYTEDLEKKLAHGNFFQETYFSENVKVTQGELASKYIEQISK